MSVRAFAVVEWILMLGSATMEGGYDNEIHSSYHMTQ